MTSAPGSSPAYLAGEDAAGGATDARLDDEEVFRAEEAHEAEEGQEGDGRGLTVNAVVMFSSGVGSWMAARRYIDQHGPEGVVLLFADVKGNNPSPHAGEDEDNYRFLREAQADLGVPLVTLNQGEDIWEVFRRRRRIGSSYAANCSAELKQKPAKQWLKEHAHINTEIVIGIDWTETHRIPSVERAYFPRIVRFPLTEAPYLDKRDMLAACRERGIEPPRLYKAGFPHANCGGFCVRAGRGQFAILLREHPARYAYHEEQEERTRQHLGKDVAILSDRSRKVILARLGITANDIGRVQVSEGYYDEDSEEWREPVYEWRVRATGEPLPSAVPLTLREFRERLQAGEAELFDADDIGGCGCFVDEQNGPSVAEAVA